MSRIPTNLHQVIKQIAADLDGRVYAIRGTTSLVLQGIDMNVDDIDIVCDRETALATNEIWKDYLVKPVTFSETKQFKSYFGQFKIENVQVEIMGEWQIQNNRGNWSEVFDGSKFTTHTIQQVPVRLTTIESELAMFTAMGRWNALNKIKNQLQPSLFT